MKRKSSLILLLAFSPYSRWKNGPPASGDYFPIAVWLQNPSNAARYKAAGINLYVGLWNGPTPAQLKMLESAGMQVICEQNPVGVANKDNPIIVGWMHRDEPNNAQLYLYGARLGSTRCRSAQWPFALPWIAPCR